MPVSVLLCEGEESSFDALLLRAILQGLPLEVRPSGGKYGLGERVKARREATKNASVYAIRDRDYDPRKEWLPGVSDALPWTIEEGKSQLGWYWRRTDIESYLMDPEVVEVALMGADCLATYRSTYEKAVSDLIPYAACRSALGEHRKRFDPLPNKFGSLRKQFNKHVTPESYEPEVLLQSMESTVNLYNTNVAIDCRSVVDAQSRFEALLRNGDLAESCIEWISGKDIAIYLSGWITSNGFVSSRSFLEDISKRLKNADVETWKLLPEWMALRLQIEKTK